MNGARPGEGRIRVSAGAQARATAEPHRPGRTLALPFLAALILALAGCGVEGDPQPPEPAPAAVPPGVSVSGDASFGVRLSAQAALSETAAGDRTA